MAYPVELKFRRIDPSAILPEPAGPDAVEWDLTVPESALPRGGEVTLAPGGRWVLPLGIAWEAPPGFCARIAGRWSLASIGVEVTPALIPPGHRGEWRLVLWNRGEQPVSVGYGDCVARFTVEAALPARVVALTAAGVAAAAVAIEEGS
jgi:dUTP pyrophosphatase